MTPGAILAQAESVQQNWHGCYDESWQGLITPESFAHPAKFSFALIKRVYEYMLSQGYVQPGATVLDPFGGMGGGAVANFYGLNWVGCELEQKFHDMGQGCECTGVSPEEWREFSEQFKPDTIGQLNYKDGRHWCPACIAGAIQIKSDGLNGHRQPGLFDTAEDGRLPVGFKLTEDGMPYSLPHHYTGNLELFRKYAQSGTFAVLLNGDSRYLRRVIAQTQVDGLLSSPPYADSLERPNGIDASKIKRPGGPASQSITDSRYGVTDGQLGGMREGDFDGLITSSPFAGNTGGRGEASRNGIDSALFDRHSGGMKRGTGENPDNLDHLPMKGFEAAISSPPYNHPAKTGETSEDSWSDGRLRPIGASQRNNGGYGLTPGQLGSMSGSFDAALSSPPFADSVGSDDPDKRGGLFRDEKRRNDKNLTGTYGASEGQLGAMPGGLDTSPPFENAVPQQDKNFKAPHDSTGYLKADYGNSTGQLGTEQGQTFWSAAKMIVTESYHLLKPGSYSAWVCKKFVRNGQIVDFPAQWQQLCEACGFEYVETIRAMLVSPEMEQGQIDGGTKTIQKQKKSFFRRLAEKNGSPRIDFEEIVILRKPL